jgi:T-complex protein 1 subunit eta
MFIDPKVLCLNVELELKAEKDNAEVRVSEVSVRTCILVFAFSSPRSSSISISDDFLFLPPTSSALSTPTSSLLQEYQAIVDAEWTIIYQKLEAIIATGAKVVLSKLPIGDLATQYFADRDIFCAGRVAPDDLRRVVQAVGGSVQSTCSDIEDKHLGRCGKFEERQIGGERFNLFEGCPEAKTCTMILRGGADQFIAEVERSLHDSIMIVKRAIKNSHVVAGGGATEVRSIASLSLPDLLKS